MAGTLMNVTEHHQHHQHRLTSVGSLSLGTFLLVAGAATSLLTAPSRAQQSHDHGPTTAALPGQGPDSDDPGEVVRRGLACRHIPGLALAVVRDGEVMMSEGFGVKDVDTRDPVTPDTKFLLASLTKAFTSALLTNVMAEQRLKLSTNVRKTLTEDFKFNNTLRTIYATVEDLLAHRLGIPRNNYVRLANDYSPANFSTKIRYLPSSGGFRDSFYYSDLMYGLSSYITEQLNHRKPWKQQIRDALFTPLGMLNSTFVDDVDFKNDDVATPYIREDGQTVKASVDLIKHWGRNLGSGNIMSSANDMAQWMLMLLNQGRDRQGRRVLSDGVLDDVFSPQNVLRLSSASQHRKPVTPYSFTADGYALGWRVGYYRGYQMIYHSGSSFGYRAYLTLLPDKKVGVVSLMTGEDVGYGFRIALHTYLMDHALGLQPWINSSSICTYPEPWLSSRARNKRSADTPDAENEGMQFTDEEEETKIGSSLQSRVKRAAASLPLQAYVGSYHHAAYGTLRVTYNTTAQFLQLEYGVGLWRLQSIDGHEFDGQWLKALPRIDMEFKFLSSGSTVYAVLGTGFEPKKPPAFYRQ
ncbi:uncharacterized protein LOC143296197 [Babylonia areolata]|uniref:uncharacterized protein LOC143296197 n=1 Tax=Babylonia areolata TaxID=304850 RepID=UPI003FCF5E79